MNKRTKEALEKSIKKWERIAYGRGIDRGSGNCALCRLFLFVNGVCDDCPVFKRTGHEMCGNTPYDAWAQHHEHHSMVHKVRGKRGKELAMKELYFLRSLRE